MQPPLPATAPAREREARYDQVADALRSLLSEEDDWVAAMATAVAELHHAFEHYDWTGFYRAVGDDLLIIGPYQGGHGCLRISFGRGVCGAAARTRATQRVDDVNAFADHIACSATTRSEIVVPLIAPGGRLLGVLDVDSDLDAAFTDVDQRALEAICADLARRFADTARL